MSDKVCCKLSHGRKCFNRLIASLFVRIAKFSLWAIPSKYEVPNFQNWPKNIQIIYKGTSGSYNEINFCFLDFFILFYWFPRFFLIFLHFPWFFLFFASVHFSWMDLTVTPIYTHNAWQNTWQLKFWIFKPEMVSKTFLWKFYEMKSSKILSIKTASVFYCPTVPLPNWPRAYFRHITYPYCTLTLALANSPWALTDLTLTDPNWPKLTPTDPKWSQGSKAVGQ